MRPLSSFLLGVLLTIPAGSVAETKEPERTPATLASAVRAAIDDADHELDKMPFFVRPIVRGKFKDRTGLSYDDWRKRLDAIHADDTPATVRARWPDVDKVLTRLIENFRGAPDRARKGMGNDPERLREIERNAAARVAAAQALLDWVGPR